ncbi:hypothetical protein EYC84_005948 [Monilinia fructicola]|uniref:Uncharacterized protein n=1 Tax=Monilinia fructicola TaxID=38448 RepID=A0A5M9K146_MONFR|nr:hypothetical protein EYC84_005948 [Monilinia fructicola]
MDSPRIPPRQTLLSRPNKSFNTHFFATPASPSLEPLVSRRVPAPTEAYSSSTRPAKVLAAQAGSPKGTLEVVEKLIGAPADQDAEEEAKVEATPSPAAPEAEIPTQEPQPEAPQPSDENPTQDPSSSDHAAPETNGGTNGTNGTSASKDDIAKADVAADVADTAEKLDSKDSEAKAAEDST